MAYRIVGSHMLRHIILLFNFKFKFIIAPDIICEMDFHSAPVLRNFVADISLHLLSCRNGSVKLRVIVVRYRYFPPVAS